MESDARFERIERTMEFLAQSQARFDANQARFDVRMDRISADLETIVRVQQGHQVLVETIFEAQRKTDEKMRELIEQGKRTDLR